MHMRDTPKARMVQIIDYIMIDLQVQKEVVAVVVTVYEGRYDVQAKDF